MLLAAGLLVLIHHWGSLEGPSWWAHLSVPAKRFVEGIVLEVFGISFLWIRVKTRTLRPESFLDWKQFLFEAILVVGGIVCLFEAIRAG